MAKKKIGLICVALLAVVAIFCITKEPNTANGKEYNIKETLPTKLSIDPQRLSLLIESSNETAAITAEVLVNDKPHVSGRQQNIQIEVTGNTLFSSTPRTHLKAF